MSEISVNIHAAKTQLSQLGPAPNAKRSRLPQDDPLLLIDEYGFDGPVSGS